MTEEHLFEDIKAYIIFWSTRHSVVQKSASEYKCVQIYTSMDCIYSHIFIYIGLLDEAGSVVILEKILASSVTHPIRTKNQCSYYSRAVL